MFVYFVILQVLVAITHGNDSPTLCFKAFDIVSKSWKHLTYMNQPQMKPLDSWSKKRDIHLTAEHIGNHLYVAVDKCIVYCYSIDQNLWEELPRSPSSMNSLCAIGDYMYALRDYYQVPQRYSFSECRWQPIAEVSDCSNYAEHRYSAGATVFNSKLYALFGCAQRTAGSNYSMQKAMLHCFDPSMNRWEFLSNTCEPHFESTLFVVNDKLCVAGGYTSAREHTLPVFVYDELEVPSVEVYNAEAKYWSIVPQRHIPQNSFGAIEVEGRVYFIINNFPFDSGIRIPPGEQYPVHLGEWGKLNKVDRNTVLCYLPVKRKP